MIRIHFRSFSLIGLALTLYPSVAFCQEKLPVETTNAPTVLETNVPSRGWFDAGGRSPSYFSGNHDFDRFIGFMSNPIQNVDPRAVTEMWPIFGSSWATGDSPRLPTADMQCYGAGMYIAL